jgi:hypothetical protein
MGSHHDGVIFVVIQSEMTLACYSDSEGDESNHRPIRISLAAIFNSQKHFY